jgi:hypothetical protein
VFGKPSLRMAKIFPPLLEGFKGKQVPGSDIACWIFGILNDGCVM